MNLKHLTRVCLALCLLVLSHHAALLQAATRQPAAVSALLNRIGGEGTADRFVTVLDESLAATDGSDRFVITSDGGKPCIKGSSTLALTTGINWYLNHVAHINLAWNRLTTDLTSATLPLPAGEEAHQCSVPYRYYLNYCTFSYSMSTWTWERWQQEIDWMALHGINMPLQIVGLDAMWHNLLTKDLGYTDAEANKFIAGPCFQAWWGMNNLQGWGGPNPSWWYERQEQLCKQILARQRELGMEPVLPGYSGMVPSDIASKGYKANNQGNWCSFLRPYILDPNSAAFTEISALYYKRLTELMGTSTYYSMDPFHEGANTSGIDVASAYKKIADAMLKANAKGKWVIQFWQWSGDQYNVLSKVDKGRLIVLDLFSDAHTHFGEYQGHDAIYCVLPNFGGRTGLFGRLTKQMEQFFAEKKAHSNVKGVGATPEAIEQVPVLYDAIFEMPWHATVPDAKAWVVDYAQSRYGKKSAQAETAWELLRNSALACPTSLQGPQEAVLCARPALTVNAVSSWGGTEIFYNAQDVVEAAFNLLAAGNELSGDNYSYDLTDVTRQALTDYANQLLKAVNSAYSAKNKTAYAQARDAYLQLILDIDELLNTNQNFMLGRWTNMARGIADEATGTTEADRQWLELDNARTLITTWGARDASESGGLRDYSYREWGGMMKDFYYDRWNTFFKNLDAGKSQPDWFDHDWAWAHNASLSYSNQPVGSTAEVAERLLHKYFATFKATDGTTSRVNRIFATDASSKLTDKTLRGKAYALPLDGITASEVEAFSIDLNNDGAFGEGETLSGVLSFAVPASAVTGRVKTQIKLTDGTQLTYSLILKDEVTTARTITVASADEGQGKVAIVGATGTSISTTDDVTVKATAASGYDFYNWTDAQGNVVSTENPYTYYGAADATLTAHFIVNKWGTPKEDLSEISTIDSYGQYVTLLTASQPGRDAQAIYSASSCPNRLFQTSQMVEAAQGSQLTLHWTSAGGLNYCRLSAYADLNSDGDFDDEGELVAVYGIKESANNTKLNDYTVQVLLPYDIPEGLTHIRLRFDGAWATGWNASNGAMPANAGTQRMVYDIPINVVKHASFPCTVTVKGSDGTMGTVDANGQTDTYTYGAGEEIVLRAYPAEGCVVKCWQDQYGRTVPDAWRDGHFLRFRAPESGTYTAVFGTELPTTLALGNWEFSYTEKNDNITLTKALKGEGDLVIPAKVNEYSITGMAADALCGQTALTSLSISAVFASMGSDELFSTQVKGDGTQDAAITLPAALATADSWNIALHVTTDGSSFNQWGSALLATGTEALGATYTDGFQLYLKADGSLLLKMGSDELKQFAMPAGTTEFDVLLAHSAARQLAVTVTAGGTASTYEATGHQLVDIASLCTALPEGINITSLSITNPDQATAPFRGCTNLSTLKVASGNKQFKAVSDVLYSSDGSRLIAFPEGRLSHRLSLPGAVRTIGAHAFTKAPELERVVITGTSTKVAVEDEAFEDVKFFVQVAPSQAAAYRSAWGMPIVASVAATASLSEANASLLTTDDAVDFSATDTKCGTAASLPTEMPVWLTRTFKAGQLYLMCFPTAPTAVSVEGLKQSETSLTDLRLLTFDGATFTPGTECTAGAWLMQVPDSWGGKRVTFRFAHAAASALAENMLSGNGTTAVADYAGLYYNYDAAANRFTRQPAGSIAVQPFTALLKATEAMPETIDGPAIVSGIGNVTIDGGEAKLFTPAGRQASAADKSVVISTKGVKVVRR